MNPRIAAATAQRVLQQLGHDKRTIALLLVAPCALTTILKYVFAGTDTFDRIGGPILGLFPLLCMFLVTSIAMLRERTSGTLERLLTTPMGKFDLLLGYAGAFAVAAVVQAALESVVAFGLLDLHVDGERGAVILLAIANGLLGMALGLFVSAFAKSEFQAVQFMPAFILPQVLLCGLLTDRADMGRPLELTSNVLPMTYAYDGLSRVAQGLGGATLVVDVLVVVGFAVAALSAGAFTLRRQTT